MTSVVSQVGVGVGGWYIACVTGFFLILLRVYKSREKYVQHNR